MILEDVVSFFIPNMNLYDKDSSYKEKRLANVLSAIGQELGFFVFWFVFVFVFLPFSKDIIGKKKKQK